MKKLIGIMLAAVLLAVLAPTAVFAADGTTEATNYDELVNAIADSANSTVVITADIVFPDSAEQISVTRSVTIRSAGGRKYTIQGNKSSRLFYMDDAATLTLQDLNLKNGGVNGDGGAVYIGEGTGIFENCAFSENSIGSPAGGNGKGGAVAVVYGKAVFTGCTFKNNVGSRSSSGDMTYPAYSGAVFVSYSDSEFTDCVFDGNSAYFYGGALFVDHGTFKISGCSFINNKLIDSLGGAVFILEGNGKITDSEFKNNYAPQYGGAVQIVFSAVQIANCVFDGNSVDDYGGAVCVDSASKTDWDNCTFRGNKSADDGGAVYLEPEADNAVQLSIFRNSMFYDNSGLRGASIYNAGVPEAIGFEGANYFDGNGADGYGLYGVDVDSAAMTLGVRSDDDAPKNSPGTGAAFSVLWMLPSLLTLILFLTI